mgnify:FL=1
MPTTQDGRTLQLMTSLGKDYLLINNFRCSDGLNQLFHLELELLHEEEQEGFVPTSVEPASVLGTPMVIAVLQPGEVERYFHGICNVFTQRGRNKRFSSYRAELVPSVWRLTQISRSRIFQNKSVPDILKDLLKDYEFRNELQETYEPRNYCVQYRESDWAFASRLMEEEGIFYFFEHSENRHQLVLADKPASHPSCPGLDAITFAFDRSEIEDQWIPAIYTWQVDDAVLTGKMELRDFNFQLPTNRLETVETSRFDVGSNKTLENYEWPGGYAKRYDGIDPNGGERASDLNKVFPDRERTGKIRQEQLDVNYTSFSGTGNCSPLSAGHKFAFKDHPLRKYNADYVLTKVEHYADQSPDYVSDIENVGNYEVSFSCIKHGAGQPTFRPPRITRKPIVHGSQTAFVVGPAGEEIFTDKYGRVKVQFHWDRENEYDQKSSCWLRVSQMWAGNNWGSMFIPRIGMEVLVDFLEGDPDQPIITGCVYNPGNMPPYTLPDDKTRSVIKTNSSKGGGGFNEIRIEDKKGNEQIFVHGEKDLDIRIKNDCKEIIRNDRHLIVEGEQLEEVRKDKHLAVKFNQNEKVGGNLSQKITGKHDEKVGLSYAVEAGTTVHIKAGASAVIEAQASVTLKSGGSFVNVSPAGVFVSGPMIMLNSGGSAGSGSGSSPEAPKEPKEADRADAGKALPKPRALPPTPSRSFAEKAVSIQSVRIKDNVPPPSGGPGRVASLAPSPQAAQQAAQEARAEAAAPPPAAPVVKPPTVYSEVPDLEAPGSAYLQGANYEVPLIGN